MPDLDAVGDVAAGAIVGRALEPGAGEGDGHTHEKACLNCGCELTGEYCHCCGQRAHVHRTLGAFWHDLAHGVLHFEGKIWRTLPLLAWKPGELTRRYIEGQRASFISPIALFLFSVFLMFAALSATGNVNPNLGTSHDLIAAEKEATGELATLQKTRADLVAKKLPTADVDENIEETQASLDVIQTLRRKGVTEATFNRSDNFQTNLPWIRQAYEKAKANPELLIYKLKSNSYKWSWAIIPLSVPFLWLMFPFSRRFRLYDHVVFVTYSLAFVTLLVSIGTIFAYFGVTAVAPLILLIIPVHMYRQLRGAYSLGRWGAVWRTWGLLFAALIVLIIFILSMGALGLME